MNSISQISSELNALVDSDAFMAITKAMAAETFRGLNETSAQIVKSATLIDAGSRTRNEAAISEGCHILRKLTAQQPNDPNLSYNLANGLIAKADVSTAKKPDWYLLTADQRREARSLFRKAADASPSDELKARAITNLGNSLFNAHRWVEAYDNYIAALNLDPTNAVAATMAATTLLICVDRRIGSREILQSVAAKHLKTAKLNVERLRQLAGERAVQQLQPLLLKTDLNETQISFGPSSKYEKFVFENRLALSPTIEGFAVSLKRWDNLRIISITEGLNKGANVPPLFAMFNTLKSDYLAARRMAYDAIHRAPKDSGSYSDTLDYAVYGIQSSLLIFAQRACLDILDKIAVAVTEHFEFGDKKADVHFYDRWFAKNPSKNGGRSWHPSFLKSINAGNSAVIALAEVALDIGKLGYLFETKEFRNAGTHRFIVLHDLGNQPSRDSLYVEHSTVNGFKQKTLESLRLARAAIIYFVELIALEEKAKGKGVKALPVVIPHHHTIRGGRKAW
jgi:tetratricopeptide (TPR) repeat protein